VEAIDCPYHAAVAKVVGMGRKVQRSGAVTSLGRPATTELAETHWFALLASEEATHRSEAKRAAKEANEVCSDPRESGG
jgi:hypothetical protein